MVNKAHSSQQEQEQHSERGEQQSWQLCFSALSTVGKSIPRQPCCHLWSFWSRRVIYRNLFAQSQYLPVGAVKICNPSLLLPCCFSCQQWNFPKENTVTFPPLKCSLPARVGYINCCSRNASGFHGALGILQNAGKLKRCQLWRAHFFVLFQQQQHGISLPRPNWDFTLPKTTLPSPPTPPNQQKGFLFESLATVATVVNIAIIFKQRRSFQAKTFAFINELNFYSQVSGMKCAGNLKPGWHFHHQMTAMPKTIYEGGKKE